MFSGSQLKENKIFGGKNTKNENPSKSGSLKRPLRSLQEAAVHKKYTSTLYDICIDRAWNAPAILFFSPYFS